MNPDNSYPVHMASMICGCQPLYSSRLASRVAVRPLMCHGTDGRTDRPEPESKMSKAATESASPEERMT